MIYTGDALTVLKTLPKQSVNTVITSPPFWGLRDYGVEGQLGLEHTPQEYVDNLVEIFRAVREVLRDDGTVWLNLGDTYAANRSYQVTDTKHVDVGNTKGAKVPRGLKPKDLVGIPWRTAFALQDDGWYLRSDIIWNKSNAMPESIRDRPTKSHEYLFLLSKKSKYYYDAEAIKEPAEWERWGAQTNDKYVGTSTQTNWMPRREKEEFAGRNTRNKRSVWTLPTKPFKGAHFSTFPPKLVEPCVLAGCPERVCATCRQPSKRLVETNNPSKYAADPDVRGWGNTHGKTSNAQSSKSLHRMPGGSLFSTAKTVGWSDCGHNNYRPGVVLDPFTGSGTTGVVALQYEREFIGIELNPEYVAMSQARLEGVDTNSSTNSQSL